MGSSGAVDTQRYLHWLIQLGSSIPLDRYRNESHYGGLCGQRKYQLGMVSGQLGCYQLGRHNRPNSDIRGSRSFHCLGSNGLVGRDKEHQLMEGQRALSSILG